MRIVKPQRVGLLKRSILWGGRTLLSLGLVTAFPLTAPRRIMQEGEMWDALAPVLGDQMLDTGEPKARGEVVAFADYFAPDGKPVLQHGVRLAVGPVNKSIRVSGPREWAIDRQGKVTVTAPGLFATMPLRWNLAFGGPAYPENPAGIGYWPEDTVNASGRYPLPCLEYPHNPMLAPGDIVAPAGFGPRDIMLPSRQRHAGTYDRFWADHHAPGLAADASLELFQVAPADQQFPEMIEGTEPFTLENMHPELPVLTGRLPGVRARAFVRRGEAPARLEEVPLATDTLCLLPGIAVGVLIHRGTLEVSAFDHPEIDLLLAAFEWQEDEARPASHYESYLSRRLDPEAGFKLGLDDLPLSPEGWQEPPLEKAAWFRVATPRPLGISPKLQARIDEMTAQIKAATPPEIEEAIAAKVAQGPTGDTAAVKQLRAELAAFEAAAAIATNGKALRPMIATINKLSRQVADEAVGRAEAKARTAAAHFGFDYDEVLARAKPPESPRDLIATIDAEIDRAAATAPADLKPRMLAAKPGAHLTFVDQAIADLDALKAKTQALVGHLIAPPAAPPAPAAVRMVAQLRTDLAAGVPIARGSFGGLDLSGFDFSGRDLTEADFTACRLAGARFDGATLTRACFAAADLDDARFAGADLSEANFGKASLNRTDFTAARAAKTTFAQAKGEATGFAEVVFEGALMIDMVLTGALFTGATFSQVIMQRCQLDGCSFAGATTEKSMLMECRGEGVSFAGAMLNRLGLVKCRLPRADFSDVRTDRLSTIGDIDLADARFERAMLVGACFIGAALARTSWASANVNAALFNQADLREARFDTTFARGSSLMRADLGGAWLDGADFAEANLIKADLRAASLRNVSFYGADLTDTLFDDAVFEGGMIDQTLLAGRNFP